MAIKKFNITVLAVLCCFLLIAGCGNREKKNTMGATGSSSSSGYVSSTTSDEMATSFGGMVTGMRTTTSASSSAKRTGALLSSSFAPAVTSLVKLSSSLVGTTLPGLGEADNTDGHYTMSGGGQGGNGPSGTGKMWFLTDFGADRTDKSKVLYMLIPSNFTLYAQKDLTSTSIVAGQSQLTGIKYLASMWRVLSTSAPQTSGWLELDFDTTSLSTLQSSVTTFFNDWSTYGGPKCINMVMDMTDPTGNKMHMDQSMEMRLGPPTNAKPSHVTGSGTMTTKDGKEMKMVMDVYIGDNGPISGTMTLTVYTGHTATMTYNSDGTIDGVVKDSKGVQIGTIHIDANGTGTYSDTNGKRNVNK
jgi:hypothetical protein